jgi:hypothetical protein
LGRCIYSTKINRCFEQIGEAGSNAFLRTLDGYQSSGQAQPIGAVQSKLGMRFRREILKTKKPAQVILAGFFSNAIIRR